MKMHNGKIHFNNEFVVSKDHWEDLEELWENEEFGIFYETGIHTDFYGKGWKEHVLDKFKTWLYREDESKKTTHL